MSARALLRQPQPGRLLARCSRLRRGWRLTSARRDHLAGDGSLLSNGVVQVLRQSLAGQRGLGCCHGGGIAQCRREQHPLPDVTFDDQLTVDAGEDRDELAYHGPNHSPGNIFTYLPAQRVLMLVDVVFPGWVPFAYLAESQNIPGWLEAPAQALSYPFQTYIGGLLTRLGTRDDVVIQQEYVADLKPPAQPDRLRIESP
jgi:glyoxylase-like metal-dependent hydrolase (beta-lactamase superfamily II)